MSKASAMSFIKAIESDQVLQEKVKATDSAATVAKTAAEYGYEFTEEEIQVAFAESQFNLEDEELSEELLESVAGGASGEPPSASGTCICGILASTCICSG